MYNLCFDGSSTQIIGSFTIVHCDDTLHWGRVRKGWDIHLLYDAEENDNMTEFEQIFQVLTAIVDPEVAIEFYKKFKQQTEGGEAP